MRCSIQNRDDRIDVDPQGAAESSAGAEVDDLAPVLPATALESVGLVDQITNMPYRHTHDLSRFLDSK